MGLDNGITLKIKDKERFGETPKWFENLDKFKFDGDDECEFLYWRKCYNVRSEIFGALAEAGVSLKSDEYRYKFDLKTLEHVLDRLSSCYDSEWWKKNDESIWDWDTSYEWDEDECQYKVVERGVGDYYWRDLANAYRLLSYLETKDPESYELSFYDSY